MAKVEIDLNLNSSQLKQLIEERIDWDSGFDEECKIEPWIRMFADAYVGPSNLQESVKDLQKLFDKIISEKEAKWPQSIK